VTGAALADSYLSLLSLREIRRYIVRSHAVMMSVFIGVVYALLAMTESGMLILAPLGGKYSVQLFLGNALGQQPWNYPGLLVVAPWGIVTLPFEGTIAMVWVSGGVALGMAVAVLLGVALVRQRSTPANGPAALGSLAGLTPAMIALLALGACCSTTAVATAGVGAIAQVSGSTTDNLLLNNWYLGLFQMAIVYVALVAQEALLRAYGGLFGSSAGFGALTPSAPSPRSIDRRVVMGTAFRALLLIAGVTWSLAMLAQWSTTSAGGPSAAMWFDGIVVHQFLSFLAISAALFPSAVARLYGELARSAVGRWLRGAALGAGLLLLLGAPPPFSLWGVEGWGNELLSIAGVSASWGAVPPVFPLGIGLAFRWGVQYLVLGGFALVLALRPSAALAPGLWSTGARPSTPAASSAGAESGTPSST
jgi:hypothetical protein